MDYLDNNRLIAHHCGFNIMEPLPSYWTYDRFLKKMDNVELKEIMATQVKKLYEMGIVDASFIDLDSTPVAANTKQNNPKSFTKDKFNPEKQPKADTDCALGVHSASNQHNERRYEFYWGYKSHVLVDCISGLPLFELTTLANTTDSCDVTSSGSGGGTGGSSSYQTVFSGYPIGICRSVQPNHLRHHPSDIRYSR